MTRRRPVSRRARRCRRRRGRALEPRPAADAADSVRARFTKYEYRIPMRDGVKLFTSVYVPKDAGASKRYPILLNRTPYSVAPYGSDAYPDSVGPSEAAAKEGFIFVYQDVRGRFMSEGQFVDMRPFNPAKGPKDVDESSDTWDTIDWLLKNVPLPQRQGRGLGHLVPGLLRGDGRDRRPPGARRRLAPGADRRLVRRRRLSPQRRLLPAPRLQLLHLLRQAAPRADHEVAAALRPRHRRRLRVLHAGRTDAEPRPEVPQGRRGLLEGGHGARELRRLLAGPQHAAAPEGHQARRAHRGRLVRRRGPLRRARDLPVDRVAEPRDREPPGHGPLAARRLVAGHGGRARQGDVRPADLEVLRGADRAAVLPLLPQGRRRPEAARGLRLRDGCQRLARPRRLAAAGGPAPRPLPLRERPALPGVAFRDGGGLRRVRLRPGEARSLHRGRRHRHGARVHGGGPALRRDAGRTSSCTRPSRWRRT